MNMNALVFVSNLWQMEYAREFMAPQLGEVRYVCLSPAVEYTAHRLGLPAVCAEDCWDPAALARRDPDRWRRCEDFARFLDAEMDLAFDGICARGEFSALFYVLELKLMFDSAERMVSAASGVVNQFRPRIVACMTEPAVDSAFGVSYPIGDMVCRALRALRSSGGFELLDQALPALSFGPGHRPLSPERILRRGLGRASQVTGRIGIRLFFPPDRNLPVVAIGQSNTLAQLPDLVRKWRRARGPVADIGPFLRRVMVRDRGAGEPAMDGRRLRAFWQELSRKSAFRAWFDREGSHLFSVMEPWLERFVCEGIPGRIAASRAIEGKLYECRASLFLTPSMGAPGVSESLLACRRLGIPSCSVQHGGMGFYTNPIVEYGDHRGPDYALTYGPGSVEFFREEFSDRDGVRFAEPVAIGNAVLQGLYRKFRRKGAAGGTGEKKRALYIPTHLVPDFYHHGLVSYPPMWYSRLQRRIVRMARDFPDVKFLIKPYPVEPVENPLAAFVRDEGITNVTFLPAFRDMMEFLEKADLLLIDYPSTSLLKMLCTRKPMIVYFHPEYLRFSPKALELLERRARVCRTEEELEAALREFYSLPAWPEIADPDDSFLIAFGIAGKGMDARKELKRLIPAMARKESRKNWSV